VSITGTNALSLVLLVLQPEPDILQVADIDLLCIFLSPVPREISQSVIAPIRFTEAFFIIFDSIPVPLHRPGLDLIIEPGRQHPSEAFRRSAEFPHLFPALLETILRPELKARFGRSPSWKNRSFLNRLEKLSFGSGKGAKGAISWNRMKRK